MNAARLASPRRTLALLGAALLCLLSASARAAACCVSATSFGVGRLLVWEDFAVGVQLGHLRSLGQWDARGKLTIHGADFSDGLTRAEPWAIVRLHPRLQLQARLPLVLNDREVGADAQLAGGLGDVGAALRAEAISLGEYDRLPSLAVTLGALAPTGRRAEQAFGPLGAGVTGRGAWGLSLAVESEYTWLPWYVRLDAGVSAFFPFTRTDTGATQLYGPLGQLALSAGRELVADRLVAALTLQGEWEWPLRLDGVLIEASRAGSFSVAGSLSWRVEPHWTLVAGLSTSFWPSGAGLNRDARVGLSLGVRYGHF